MKLRRADLAAVPEKKITHYLLNPAHPAGGSKAAFFLRFGFTAPEWSQLAHALLRHAGENEVVVTPDPSRARLPACGDCQRPADAMNRNDLKPLSKQLVYDFVTPAGVDTSDRANYRRLGAPSSLGRGRIATCGVG